MLPPRLLVGGMLHRPKGGDHLVKKPSREVRSTKCAAPDALDIANRFHQSLAGGAADSEEPFDVLAGRLRKGGAFPDGWRSRAHFTGRGKELLHSEAFWT